MFFNNDDWNRVFRIVMSEDKRRFNHNNLLAINKNNSRKRDLMKKIGDVENGKKFAYIDA